jgi:hypothetical protein
MEDGTSSQRRKDEARDLDNI